MEFEMTAADSRENVYAALVSGPIQIKWESFQLSNHLYNHFKVSIASMPKWMRFLVQTI